MAAIGILRLYVYFKLRAYMVQPRYRSPDLTRYTDCLSYTRGTIKVILFCFFDEPHGSVGDLRTGGCWFNFRLGQYSFRGLMIVIATGFIPLLPLSVVSTMVMWEFNHWLGKNIVPSTG